MYYYFLDKENKIVFEIKCSDQAADYFADMGLNLSEVFPYEEAGYEDPYSFMDEYKIVKVEDSFIEVETEDEEANV